MLSISEGSFLGSLLETAEFAEVSRMLWLPRISSSMHHCARTRMFVSTPSPSHMLGFASEPLALADY